MKDDHEDEGGAGQTNEGGTSGYKGIGEHLHEVW
jgi:hypothetical protein